MASSVRNEFEYINTMAQSEPAQLVAASEKRYKNIISGIVQKTCAVQGHKLVLLAGPSASGKTTTAQKLAQGMAEYGLQAHRISLDDFYLERGSIPCLPDGKPDIESVHALDLPLLQETLRSLMETGRGDIPQFTFGVGKRTRWEALEIGAQDIIVLEGLHALHPEIIGHLHAPPQAVKKVYISVSSRIYDKRDIVLNKRSMRLVRRILRDHQFRGSSAEQTIAMWPAVAQGEANWLTPCKPNADFLINSIHIYEPCVFAPRVLPLLESVPADAPAAGAAARLARSLRGFVTLKDEIVPQDSLLREFLGNA